MTYRYNEQTASLPRTISPQATPASTANTAMSQTKKKILDALLSLVVLLSMWVIYTTYVR